jgi:hypothetical protein
MSLVFHKISFGAALENVLILETHIFLCIVYVEKSLSTLRKLNFKKSRVSLEIPEVMNNK